MRFPPSVRRLPRVVRSSFDSASLSQSEIDRKVREAALARVGAYEIDEVRLALLAPDLVITQELCDVCAVPQATAASAAARLPRPARILSLHPHGLDDVLADLRRVGLATGALERADGCVAELSRRLRHVEQAVAALRRPRVAALEWIDPVMASGHWVVEMIQRAGGHDFLGRDRAPSVRVEWKRRPPLRPRVLVLMPCGFDVERSARDASLLAARPGWTSLPAVAAGEVFAVHGGAYFNRPGLGWWTASRSWRRSSTRKSFRGGSVPGTIFL